MGRYRTIDGKRMDAEVLDIAEKAVLGAGDGRISLEDAKALWNAVADEGLYTEVERQTIDHVRATHKWTPAADEWFRSQEASFTHTRLVHMTPEELAGKHFSHYDVLASEEDRTARIKRLELATAEAAEQVDEEIGLLVHLDDGTVVEVYSRFLEVVGSFVQLFGGCMIPLRSIERVGI
jgi:hypothetical protein